MSYILDNDGKNIFPFNKEDLKEDGIVYDGENIQVIRPSVEIIYPPWDMFETYDKLDYIARMCYKSHDKNHDYGDRIRLLRHLIDSKHDSIFEHHSITFEITHNRAILNQLTRHRLFSFAQESTRYCNYNKDDKIRFCTSSITDEGIELLEQSAKLYNFHILEGMKPEQARDYLPLSLSSTIIVTGNLRQWRNFIRTRTHISAQPEIRRMSETILMKLYNWYPVLFEDIVNELNLEPKRKLEDEIKSEVDKFVNGQEK